MVSGLPKCAKSLARATTGPGKTFRRVARKSPNAIRIAEAARIPSAQGPAPTTKSQVIASHRPKPISRHAQSFAQKVGDQKLQRSSTSNKDSRHVKPKTEGVSSGHARDCSGSWKADLHGVQDRQRQTQPTKSVNK